MRSTSNSNVEVLNSQNNSRVGIWQQAGCCALVKEHTQVKNRIIKTWYEINHSDLTEDEIRLYLNKLIEIGIPYTYIIDSNKRVTITFPTNDLVSYQEGYVYFIFLRYLWSSYYTGLVKTALDIISITDIDIFRAIQLAHHEKNYSGGHSLYFENTGVGCIYNYKDFKTGLKNTSVSYINVFFSRQYNLFVLNTTPVREAYVKLTSTLRSKFQKLLNDKFFLFPNVKSLITSKKYKEALSEIERLSKIYNFATPQEAKQVVTPVFLKEIEVFLKEEFQADLHKEELDTIKKCSDYLATVNLSKLFNTEVKSVSVDKKVSVGDVVMYQENNIIFIGVKHTGNIIKIMQATTPIGFNSCSYFKGNEGRMIQNNQLLLKVNVELGEN